MSHPEERETAADVAAIIPHSLWNLSDDDQRDAFMVDVVLPRYMTVTSDGVKLGPDWWAKHTGATPAAIKHRVYRLRAKASGDSGEGSHLTPTANQKAHVRSAKSAVKQHPELATALASDPEFLEAILNHAPREAGATIPRVAKALIDTEYVDELVANMTPLSQSYLERKLQEAQTINRKPVPVKPRGGLDVMVSIIDMKDALGRLAKAEPGWSSDVREGLIDPTTTERHLGKLKIVYDLMRDAAHSESLDDELRSL